MHDPKHTISLRLDPATYERLRRMASKDKMTLNSVLVRLIDGDNSTERKAQATPGKVRS